MCIYILMDVNEWPLCEAYVTAVDRNGRGTGGHDGREDDAATKRGHEK